MKQLIFFTLCWSMCHGMEQPLVHSQEPSEFLKLVYKVKYEDVFRLVLNGYQLSDQEVDQMMSMNPEKTRIENRYFFYWCGTYLLTNARLQRHAVQKPADATQQPWAQRLKSLSMQEANKELKQMVRSLRKEKKPNYEEAVNTHIRELAQEKETIRRQWVAYLQEHRLIEPMLATIKRWQKREIENWNLRHQQIQVINYRIACLEDSLVPADRTDVIAETIADRFRQIDLKTKIKKLFF